MWQYEGPLDSTRMNQEELSKNELIAHVRSITSTKASEPCNVDCPVVPYGAEKPLTEVSKFIESLLFLGVAIVLVVLLSTSAYDTQGHSTVSTLPPLPEDGPTEETEVQEAQDVPAKEACESPLPSATTSPTENAEEEADEALVEAAPAPNVSKARARKRLRVHDVSSSVSSPAKEGDLSDDGDSGSPHAAQAAPLTASPLRSMPPPQVSGSLQFGGPSFDDFDSEEEEEHRFVPSAFLPV